MQQIVVQFTALGKFKSLQTELSAVNTELAKTTEQLEALNSKTGTKAFSAFQSETSGIVRGLKTWDSQMVTINNGVTTLTEKIKDQGYSINKLTGGPIERLKLAWEDAGKVAEEQLRIQNSVLLEMEKNVNSSRALMFRPAGSLAGLVDPGDKDLMQLSAFNQELKSTATNLINTGKNAQWAGRQLSYGISLPIIGGFAVAGVEAYKLNQALAELRSVLGDNEATAKNWNQISQQTVATAKDMAQQFGVAASDTVNLTAQFAAAGFQGEKLQNIVRATTKMMVAGLGTDTQSALQATISIMNVFHLKATQLNDTFAHMNALENLTVINAQDIIAAIPRAAAPIANLGGNLGDLEVLLTALKAGGISAVQGATAISRAMTSLIDPTSTALKTLGELNINIDNIFQKHKNEQFPVLGAFTDLAKQLQNLTSEQQQQAVISLFGKFQTPRIVSLMANLANNTGKVSQQVRQAEQALNTSAGQAASDYNKAVAGKFQSTSEQIKRAWASMMADLATAGQPFLSFAAMTLNALAAIFKWFGDLPGPIKDTLAALAGFAASVGPIVYVVGLLKNLKGQIINALTSVVSFLLKLRGLDAEAQSLKNSTEVANIKMADLNKTIISQRTSTEELIATINELQKSYEKAAAGAAALSDAQVAAQNPTKVFDAAAMQYRYAPGTILNNKNVGGKFAPMAAASEADLEAMRQRIFLMQQTLGIETELNGTELVTSQQLASISQEEVGLREVQAELEQLVLEYEAVAAAAARQAEVSATSAETTAGSNSLSPMIWRSGGQTSLLAGDAESTTATVLADAAPEATTLTSGLGALASSLGTVTLGVGALGVAAMGAYTLWSHHEEDVKKHQQELISTQQQLISGSQGIATILGKNWDVASTDVNKYQDAVNKASNTENKYQQEGQQWAKSNAAAVKQLQSAAQGSVFEPNEIQGGLSQNLIAALKQKVADFQTHGMNQEEIRKAVDVMLASIGYLDWAPHINIKGLEFKTNKQALTASVQHYMGQIQGYLANAMKDRAITARDLGPVLAPDIRNVANQIGSDLYGKSSTEIMRAFINLRQTYDDQTTKLQQEIVADQAKFKADPSDLAVGRQINLLENQLHQVQLTSQVAAQAIGTKLGFPSNVVKSWHSMNDLIVAFEGNEAGAKDRILSNSDALNGQAQAVQKLGASYVDANKDVSSFVSNLQTNVSSGLSDITNLVLSQYDAQHQAAAGTKTGYQDQQKAADAFYGYLNSHASETLSASKDDIKKYFDEFVKGTTNVTKATEAAQRLVSRYDKSLKTSTTEITESYDQRIQKIKDQESEEAKLEKQREANFKKEQQMAQEAAQQANLSIDFNTAIYGGDLGQAAQDMAQAQSDAITNATNAANDAATKAYNKRKAQQDDEIKRLENQKTKALDAIHKETQARQNWLSNEKSAFDQASQSFQTSASSQTDVNRQMLSDMLAQLTTNVPRTESQYNDLISKIEAAASQYGVNLKSQSKDWAYEVNNVWMNSVQMAAKQVENDNAWAKMGKSIQQKVSNAATGMTWPQFVKFIETGNLPANYNAKSAANQSRGGTGGTSSFQSGGAGGHLPKSHIGEYITSSRNFPGLKPDETMRILQKGEYVVKKPAVDYYGPGTFENINHMRVPKMHTGGVINPAFSVDIGAELGTGAMMAAMHRLTEIAMANKVNQMMQKPGKVGKHDPTKYYTGKGLGYEESVALIEKARQELGVPYHWGGTTPKGFDCCLVPDSLVQTTNGPIKIIDIKPGMEVYTFSDGKVGINQVIARSEPRIQQTYELRTNRRKIEASGNHPFLKLNINNNGAPKPNDVSLEWTHLEDLNDGDYIVTLKSLPDHKEMVDGWHGNKNYLWLLGFAIGDGHLSRYKSGMIYLCEFGKKRERVQKRLESLIKKRATEHYSHGLYIWHKKLFNQLLEDGLNKRSCEKEVPEFIWSLPHELIVEFIDGYAAADGCQSKRDNDPVMQFSSSSKNLVEQIRLLNIILGRNVTVVRKQERTKPIIIKGKLVKNAKPLYSFGAYYNSNRKGQAILRQKNVKQLFPEDSNFVPEKIKKITPLKIEETYDIEVEGAHNFIANGIVVHNSGLMQWVYENAIKMAIPRTAASQQLAAKKIAASMAQPADLLFLGNPAYHVMMYEGNGRTIEAPHTGADVQEINFDPKDATTIGRFIPTIKGFRDVVPHFAKKKGAPNVAGDLSGIKNTSQRQHLNERQIYDLARWAGFSNYRAKVMAAIASGTESGGWTTANNPGSTAYGLWQNLHGATGNPYHDAKYNYDWTLNQSPWYSPWLPDVTGRPYPGYTMAQSGLPQGHINFERAFQIAKGFDSGGVWNSGTYGFNASGKPEVVFNAPQWKTLSTLANHAVQDIGSTKTMHNEYNITIEANGNSRPEDISVAVEKVINRIERNRQSRTVS